MLTHDLSKISSTWSESNTLFLPGLQSTDGVDFRDVDNGSEGLESSTAALSHLQSIEVRLSGPTRPGHQAGRLFGGGGHD